MLFTLFHLDHHLKFRIFRDHAVSTYLSGLVTITGGKWTIYRSMEKDAVNAAIKVGNLSPSNDCVTAHLKIVGGDQWDPVSFTELAQQYVHMKETHLGIIVPGKWTLLLPNIWHMHMVIW